MDRHGKASLEVNWLLSGIFHFNIRVFHETFDTIPPTKLNAQARSLIPVSSDHEEGFNNNRYSGNYGAEPAPPPPLLPPCELLVDGFI